MPWGGLGGAMTVHFHASGHVGAFSCVRATPVYPQFSKPCPCIFTCPGHADVVFSSVRDVDASACVRAMSVHFHMFGHVRVPPFPVQCQCIFSFSGFPSAGSMLSCVRAMSERYHGFRPCWCLSTSPVHVNVVSLSRAMSMHFHVSGPCRWTFMCLGYVSARS